MSAGAVVRRARAMGAALAAVALLATAWALPAAAAGPSVPEDCGGSAISEAVSAGPGTTDTAGLNGGWHPVVLVHGWNGKPLADTRTMLEAEAKDRGARLQFLLYDYASLSQHWADYPGIYRCLAQYVVNVSDAHRALGGDGLVYLAGHSMGGLAIRFAATAVVDGAAGPTLAGDRIGGITAINTPHLGSPFGGTDWAGVWDGVQQRIPGGARAVPARDALAGACLASHTSSTSLPAGCAKSPYVTAGTPLTQITGDVAIHRSAFGVDLFGGWDDYDVHLSGDGIVPLTSEAGYPTSGPGSAPLIPRTTTGHLACTVTDESLTLIARGLGGARAAALVAAGAGRTLVDWQGIDAMEQRNLNPYVVATLVAGAFTSCGHLGITTNPEMVAELLDSLDAQVADDGVLLTETGVGRLRQMTSDQMSDYAPQTSWGSGLDVPANLAPGARASGDALDSLTRLLGEPDEVQPSNVHDAEELFCPWPETARWGDLSVRYWPEDNGGRLMSWSVTGPDVPSVVQLPFDLQVGEPLSDAAEYAGSAPVQSLLAEVTLDGLTWLSTSQADDPTAAIDEVTSGFPYWCE